MSSMSLIEVQNLKKYFPVRRGILRRVVAHVHAVDDINFTISQGQCSVSSAKADAVRLPRVGRC